MPNLVQNAYPIFTDVDGEPLENGYIFIGQPGLDPETNPLAVFWDSALTNPATNIRTKGGYPSNSGTPSRLYTATDYSITVKDKKGALISTLLTSTDYFNAPSGGVVLQADTIAELRNTVPSDPDTNIFVSGYYSVGDGGGGPLRYWDASSCTSSLSLRAV